LKNRPLGKLVVILSGTKENMEQAIQYIQSRNVQMEVIRE